MGSLAHVVQVLTGLAVGSFLNVLAFRYDAERGFRGSGSIAGRSHCPHCHHLLRWYELIPIVSFLAQGGRCRSCKAKISLQYPIVELLTALAFLVIPQTLYRHYGIAFAAALHAPLSWYYALSALWILAACVVILIAAIDFRLTIIPDELNALLALAGIAITLVERASGHITLPDSFVGFYAPLFGFSESVWTNIAMGIAAGAGLFALIVLLTRGRGMGVGDVKLGAAGGILLGWPDMALAVALAFIIGALVNLPALFRGKRSMKDAVPFGPFIVLGMALAFFFGNAILAGYFALFPV